MVTMVLRLWIVNEKEIKIALKILVSFYQINCVKMNEKVT